MKAAAEMRFCPIGTGLLCRILYTYGHETASPSLSLSLLQGDGLRCAVEMRKKRHASNASATAVAPITSTRAASRSFVRDAERERDRESAREIGTSSQGNGRVEHNEVRR